MNMIIGFGNRTQKSNSKTKHTRDSKRYSKTSRNLKRMNCSPLVNGKPHSENTCYTHDILTKLRDAYNKNNPQTQIADFHPKDIWTELKTRLTNCKTEDCWLSQLPENEKKYLDKKIFRPDQPPEWRKNHNEWLSNYDIFDVLYQYEETYPNFEFLGPTSIDFDAKLSEKEHTCVTEEICKISLPALKKRGINKIGIVFNLDKHNEPGSHWTSMFIDFGKRIIYYFDSAANPTPTEITQLKDRLIDQGKQLHPKIHFTYHENFPHTHQHTNTECGMYSLFFIITMLTGMVENENPKLKPKRVSLKKRIEMFTEKKIPDKFVENYRGIYFNTPN